MKKELTNSFGKVFISIAFDRQSRWIYNNWLGYQSFENVVAGANACLEFIERHQVTCVLNDNRLVVGPWHHAINWIAQDWSPRAQRAGMRFFAHVVDRQTLAGMSAEDMNQKVGDTFEMRVFDDLEEAKAWLQQCR